MASALERAEAKYSTRSALDRAEEQYGSEPPASTGQSAKDVVMKQIGEIEHSPPVKDKRTSAGEAIGHAVVQGLTMGQAASMVEQKPQGFEALAEQVGVNTGLIPKEAIEARDRGTHQLAEGLREAQRKASADRPAESLAAEVASSALLPGPKGGVIGRAVQGAAEGMTRSMDGGNVAVGGLAGGVASGAGGSLGKVASKLASRGETRAAAAVSAAAARKAAQEADEVAKAARAKVATAGAAPVVGPSSTNQVVRVMSKDGKSIQAIGSIEEMDGNVATVFAGGRRLQVPMDRVQPIKTVSSKGMVGAPPRDADKLVAAAEKEATKAERAAKKAETAAAKAERAARPGGNKGFAKLATAAGVGGAGAYAIPSIVEDPDKAAEKLAKGAAGAAAGLALLKGKGVAARGAERGAAAISRALDTAAGRVSRATAGAAATGARRVGAGLLAKIVIGRRQGQDTSQLEQQALDGGATPQEVQSAVNAGSRR